MTVSDHRRVVDVDRVRPALRPDVDDHLHALRVAIGLLFPAIVLLAIGRPELMIYAVFGAFAGMYGRTEIGRRRQVQQVQAAVLLTASVAIGVLLAQSSVATWVLVVVVTGFAMAVSVVADVLRLRPVGPFFFLFALGATAVVSAGLADPGASIGICAGTAALALAVGCIGTSPRVRGTGRSPSVAIPSGAWMHATRYGMAIGAAGGIGIFLGFAHANWAMASAAVPLAAMDAARVDEREVRLVLTRAAHRVAGTFAGLAATAVVLAAGLSPSLLAALMVALLFPTELFMVRHYAVAIGFFTPLIMLMCQLAAPTDPLSLIGYRGLDTVIGVVVGVGVAIVARGARYSPRS